ncbi:Holliday junction resolvase RecU [Desulfofundulus thermosubterraneus]|uniref:Holliday junction resolvase RecU n=1 Tax=Desulfofundulus thermosubterraneus DSM 16057 TaxID=1121432 RepID=A0A1M6JG73_9FIRM|nr:Holliday junction resolvase RecU [Desulfofundulus thermosubterraneus]SHJ45718.1 recombination protein U [Desulfofundulus thermosubterraneus DSM 16057]
MRAVYQANRGQALEDLIKLANDRYRSRKLAVIHKVPTAWVPIRGPGGKIVSAKVEEKASVDFLGHVLLSSGPLPLAFDAKEVSRGDRWPLSKLEPHQYEYLRDCALTGAFSFVLIGFWELERFFILPFPELERRWAAWKDRTGPASVRAGESGLVEVKFWDYLSFVL